MKSMSRREAAQLTFEGITQPIFSDEYISSNFNSENSKSVTDGRIRNRENIFKLICLGLVTIFILVLLLLFIYNIVVGNYKFTFADLRFSDLLSLTMAIFAIFLSIAFYFKASETSNTFYDNTYRFTTHVSELLGRIESGFKERLRHIDEGQVYLKERFDKNLPYTNPDSTKKEISEEEQKLKKELIERENLITQLVEKTALQANEKKDVVSQLKEKDKSIDEMKKEISRLNRQLNHETREIQNVELPSISPMQRYIASKMHHISEISDVPLDITEYNLKMIFEDNVKKFNQSFIRDMNLWGFLDENNKLTERGLDFVIKSFHRVNLSKEKSTK
jgi:hypothetical protein